MYIFTFVAQPGLDILKSLAFCFMFNAGRKKMLKNHHKFTVQQF